MLRIARLSVCVSFGLLGFGCSSTESVDPGSPDVGAETQDTGTVDTGSIDAAVDTFIPHTPKAARCEIPDGGTVVDSATDTFVADTFVPDTSASDDSSVDDASTDAADAADDAEPPPPVYIPPLQ